ncbi:DUF2129 domain-containing protein [Macrococcus equipercicus]|uniref:DUF2129 domain-containing protein n=1 Tax=Macrococcus equipercicus TaxID=69967 RepID=A0A9Q9F1X5_9STAP|nr:DUF2129 domain-containing protein [Macrococcus equipercicus]KAA1042697.1 DUF2129 domain-containing protein [Macrococcus equipercicus]UTH14563.1 DUF2129 domain-containing protein [Macrococcus equipercicus]
MNIIERTHLIVYLKSPKHERQIRKFGHIVYSSKKDKWLSLYIDKEKTDDVLEQLAKLKYVVDVQISPYSSLERSYESTHRG